MRPSLPDPARRTRPRRGTAAVEFAILLPFLMLLVVVAIDFSRLFHQYTVITNAARNGALYASSYAANQSAAADSPYTQYSGTTINWTSSIQAATLGTRTGQPSEAGTLSPIPTVSYSPNPLTATASTVDVTVTYNFPMLTSYLGFGTQTIRRTVRMSVAPVVPN